MKTIIKKGSCNVGGLVFGHKNIPFLSIYEWIEQGFPDNTYVHASPDVLTICNIPILDCYNDDGLLIKKKPSKLFLVNYSVPTQLFIKKQKVVKYQNWKGEGLLIKNPLYKTRNSLAKK